MKATLRMVALAAAVATAVSLGENVLASPAAGTGPTSSRRADGWHWTAAGNSIAINQSGITLTGPNGSSIKLDSTGGVKIVGVTTGVVIDGTVINLNCSGGAACQPVARQGDPVNGGVINQGAPTVLAG